MELLDVQLTGASPDIDDFRAVKVRRDEGSNKKRKTNGVAPINQEDEGESKHILVVMYMI